MAERLEKIAREINPGNSVFFSAEGVEVFGSQVGAIQDSERLKQVLPGFALDLLNAGRTEEAIDVLAKVGLNLVHVDYNNDGYPDVFVLRGAWFGAEGHHPKSLLRNNGDGTFSDVTEEAGLLSSHPTQTAVWFDYNNDGWIDLFIGHESAGPDINPCELYRNNGDGTFAECAASARVANIGFVKGVTAGDYNNDGRPDLYLSRRAEPNLLYRNDGPKDPKQGARFNIYITITIDNRRLAGRNPA